MKLLLANPRKRAPAKKRRAAPKRRTHVATTTAAPKRRRRSRLHAVAHRTVHHTKRRVSRGVKRARHSLKGLTAGSMATVKIGLMAGAGAVVADIIAAKINQFLPANMQTGVMQQVTQAAVSLIAGLLLNKVNKTAGHAVAMGGVTIATYNLAHSMLAGKGIPGIAEYDPLAGNGLLAYTGGDGMSGNDGLLGCAMGDNDMSAYENGGYITGSGGY